MTIREANTIPLVQLLEKLGFMPVETPDVGNDVWYRSPFRPTERSTNFHVDKKRNIWYDFVTNSGGTNLDFIKTYNACEDATALTFISDYFKAPTFVKPFNTEEKPTRKERFALKEVKPLNNPALLTYLTDERRIKTIVVKKFLVEALFTNTEEQKDYFAAAIKNESNGYEIRNKYFDGFLGKKDITILRGEQPTENSVSIFIDVMDFLSAADYYGSILITHDVIIVHHHEFFEKALRLVTMRKYSRVFTYFNNNEVGEAYVKTYQTAFPKIHEPCHGFYYPFENFNAYWKATKRKLS
jgi:hypothetical protein